MRNPKALIIAVTAAALVAAAAPTRADVDDVARRAQGLAVSEQWSEAIGLVKGALLRLDSDSLAADAGGKLYFTLGYLCQAWAPKDVANRRRHLQDAEKYYHDASSRLPGNEMVLYNLSQVQRDLGTNKEAAKTLEVLVASNDDARYLIALGDCRAALGQNGAAMKAYRRADTKDPADETAKRRILALFESMPDTALPDLMRYSTYLQRRKFDELAASGFEIVLARGGDRLALRALVPWTELRFADGVSGARDLEGLHSVGVWSSPPMRGLRHAVESPAGVSDSDLEWWRHGLYRRHVIATVLRAVAATDARRNPRPAGETRAILEHALKIAPESYEYYDSKLRGRPVVGADIALDMAGLLHRNPSLDPDGRRFRNLVRELFNEKSKAYAASDSSAIQRGHTVLGIIYADNNVWSSGWDPANARFQLEHATAVARARAKRDGSTYQPLPHLYRRLVDGYTVLGNDKKAYTACLDAAQGYLDLDDVGRARAMLERTRKFTAGETNDERSRNRYLGMIVTTRSAVPSAATAPAPGDSTGDLSSDNSIALSTVARRVIRGSSGTISDDTLRWLDAKPPAYMDPSFVRRQQFKCLSDLAAGADARQWQQSAATLRKAALEHAFDEPALASMHDVARLEAAGRAIQRDIALDASRPTVSISARDQRPSDKVWSVNAGAGGRPLAIGVSRDLLLASKVQAVVPRKGALPAMSLRGGVLRLHNVPKDSSRRTELQRRVKKLGVKLK